MHTPVPIALAPLLSLLTEIVSSQHSLKEILESTVRLLRETMRVERCSILLTDPAGDELFVGAAEGMTDELKETVRLKLGEGIAGSVALTGVSQLGYRTPTPEEEEDEERRHYTGEAYVCVPIMSANKTLGVLSLTNEVGRNQLNQHDLKTIEAVARLLTVTIERHLLNRRVESLADELTSLFRSLPVGIIACNAKGEVSSTNVAAQRMLGLENGATIKALTEVLPDKMVENFTGLIERAIQSRRAHAREYELPGPPPQSLRVQGVPMVEDDSKGHRALLIMEDMSLRREIEHLRRVESMQNSFLMMVSHELRTPLTSIRGAASLLGSQMRDAMDEDQQALLRIMGSNIERLITSVNTILDVTLLEQDGIELIREPSDVGIVVERALEHYQSDINAKQLTLKWERPAAFPTMLIDVNRLTQAIGAILDNAIKFSRNRGDIFVTADLAGDTVALEIRDFGEGIPAEFRFRAFEKFTQAEEVMTRRRGGSGLGLYLAHHMVRLHHGRITIQDVLEGACIRVELPVRPSALG